MLLLIVLAAELSMILDVRRRIKVVNFPEICCWFILISHSVFFFGDFFFASKERWITGVYRISPGGTHLYYFAIFLLIFSSTLGIKIKGGDSSLRVMRLSAVKALSYNWIALSIVTILVFTHALFIDHEILWSNKQYILIRSAASIDLFGFGGFLQSIMLMCGLASGFYLAMCLAFKQNISSCIWGLLFSWLVLFFLSDASRNSFLLISEFGALLISLNKHRRFITGVAIGILALVALSSSLYGRGAGSFGLAAVPAMIVGGLDLGNGLREIIGNLFQGILSTSEGMHYPADFATSYKLLSFSPFPSIIDGFDQILPRYQIRLASYVPMSAFAEVYHFGWFYFLLLMAIFWINSRVVLRRCKSLGPSYYLFTFLILIGFVMGGAYPVRTVSRILAFGIALLVLRIVMIIPRRAESDSRRGFPSG